MSDNEISNNGDDNNHKEDPKKKQRGYRKKIRKAKQVVLFPFRKVKKLYRKKKSSSANPSGKGCYFCFMHPPATDSSSVNSQTSDPNNPQFSYEFVKALIENNDFYSKECNVHSDVSKT